ncbi:MAG: hypothetical protein U5L45_02015 [Saprospiraceae bacterium]|nr:hypothetical protein [Saprospiraceae bacterium]
MNIYRQENVGVVEMTMTTTTTETITKRRHKTKNAPQHFNVEAHFSLNKLNETYFDFRNYLAALASLAENRRGGSFFGKVRKMNHILLFCERSEQ